MRIAIERRCRKLDRDFVRTELERIFNGAHIAAQAFLPADFRGARLHFATEFTLEAGEQDF